MSENAVLAFVNVTFLQVTVFRTKKTFLGRRYMCTLLWHEQSFGVLIFQYTAKKKVDSFHTSDKFVGYEITM